MRIPTLVTLTAATTLLICSLAATIIFDYQYDINYSQYLKLADDASTPDAKFSYLKQYRDAVSAISRNDAFYVFKQKQYTRDEQLKILDTLLFRLDSASRMSASSFEYQQAMYQISGQEMNHTLERIDNVFMSCYMRSGAFFAYWCMFNWFIVVALGVFGLILALNDY